MYGKIFDSMYDSTISANWQGMVTFQQMLVLKDEHGIIDMTPPALSRRTGIPLEIIEKGIKYLEAADPYSRSPDYDGARIVRLDEHRPWGWFIVNHKHYRELSSRADKREYDKKRYQKAKSEKPSEKSGKEPEKVKKQEIPQSSTDSTHTDTDTDTGKDKESKPKKKSTRFIPPTVEQVKAYLEEKEITHLVNPVKFVKHYESANWYRNKTKIKCWKSCVCTWVENAKEWAKQKGGKEQQPISGKDFGESQVNF